MKRVLGLDLGTGSVGWAVVEVSDDYERIERIAGLGSRIVPLSKDETQGFTKGSGESVCHLRTVARTARKGLDRFQQRRKMLGQALAAYGMTFGEDLLKLSPMDLWQLRADAATGRKLRPDEIGRVVYHINSRRGYKHASGEISDKKNSDYLAAISGRVEEAKEKGQTPGQYFAERLKKSEYVSENGKTAWSYRVKEKVFLRKAYEEELHRILKEQQAHYPDLLTDERIKHLEDVIFYQRPLKSCKHLVSLCEFESRECVLDNGKRVMVGSRVAHATSPLFQVCRIWEAVNAISLKNIRNKRRKSAGNEPELPLFGEARKMAYEFRLTPEERQRVFDFLNTHEIMKSSDLLKILGLKKDDGFSVPANIVKGLKGNFTRDALKKALGDMENADELLRFDLSTEDSSNVDEETGELMPVVSSDYLRQPLYRLWHTVYSISDRDELAKTLGEKFGITDPLTVDRLFHIDFRGKGYGNKSSKFICKLIPWLQRGFVYSEACEMAGVNHSGSLTKEENEERALDSKLRLLKKGELRQPVVEKILNQMINIVNAAVEAYGPMDEIRVELARELKKSKDERVADYKRNSERERKNKDIADKIREMGMRPTVNKIQKYRMWQESEGCCMYCGQTVNEKAFLAGVNAEKEHVIPRSLFFDDSFSNKVCACRECNARKGQQTGYDFMEAQGDAALQIYINRVERLYQEYKSSRGKSGISKTKHDRLMTPAKEIPQDFIERELRQTQYISRKAMEILRRICRNVYASSGMVTDFFRHAWGYDDILHRLNLKRYSDAGQTEVVEYEHKNQLHREERIIGWSKRLDHRHHAIDALTVALTRQGYVQRLNTLNALKEKNADAEAAGEYAGKMENLEKWAVRCPHLSVRDVEKAVDGIAVSFKSGKKVATRGKRFVFKAHKREEVQTGLLVPRGPLTKSTVYGMIKRRVPKQNLKILFADTSVICNPAIRKAVEERLAEYGFDVAKAVSSCRKHPLLPDGFSSLVMEADCWKEEVVVRKSIEEISSKNIENIVDGAVRRAVEARYREVGMDDKKFVKSLADRPVFRDAAETLPIKRLRCTTGLSSESIVPVKKDAEGKAVGYGKFGNNHHIALYETPEGEMKECVVPFVYAVERILKGFPVVVEHPDEVWDRVNDIADGLSEDFLARFPRPGWRFVMSMQQNEMFILGLSTDEVKSAFEQRDVNALTSHLYRVQKLSSWSYHFKRHVSTLSDTTNEQIANGNYIRVKSSGRLEDLNPVKVRVDLLGRIRLV